MTADRDVELEHLAAVDRHLDETSRILASQMTRLEKMRHENVDTTDVEGVLAQLDQMMTEWQIQREAVIERIAVIDQQAGT